MRSTNLSRFLALSVAAFTTCGAAIMAADLSNGLELSLSGAGANDLKVSLRNTSDHDAMLKLGMMLAPGVVRNVAGKDRFVPSKQYQFPDAISLVLVDSAGKSRELELLGPAGVAGTVEPLEVPLPPGAMYSIQLPLSKYCEPKTFKPIGTGTVQLTAKLTCKDAGGSKNRHYWVGTLKSNSISIKL